VFSVRPQYGFSVNESAKAAVEHQSVVSIAAAMSGIGQKTSALGRANGGILFRP
jgi:hypothetical protein